MDYGVWGARVPSAGFGGLGVGGVAPSVLLDIYRHLRDNLVMVVIPTVNREQ